MSISGGRNIGGVVGIAGGSNSGNILRSYATGEIELTAGGSFSGGVVGYLSDGSLMTQSYWDVQTTGIPTDLGNNGKTTAQMTYPGSLDTFAAWDFAAIWRHDIQGLQNSGYPYLAWQEAAIPGTVQDLLIERSGNQFQLEWQPVIGVGLYKVYASEDPYAPWQQWSFLGQSTTTTYTATGGSKRFFMVRAVSD